MNNIDKQQLFNIIKDLISFKSISPDEAGCLNYIENLLKLHGFRTKRLDKNLTSNLIAQIGNPHSKSIAFAGHIDIVPTGNINEWKFNPFNLTEDNDYLYGRGIADMKGSVAAFISAILGYLKNHSLNDKQILILLTSDEESSAIDGTSVIVEYLKDKSQHIDYCLLGEPSSIETLGDNIKIGRRGSLTGNLEVFGRQGHIAYPESCINPIHLFTNALNELIQTTWDTGTDIFPPSTLQFSNLNSGLGVSNVVPGSLFACFNIRYNNLHSANDLQLTIESILKKHNLNYSITWHNSAKPFYNKEGKLITAIKQSIENQLSVLPKLNTDGGTSDGRFLVEVCNEIAEFGLVNKTIHQINERIKAQDLYNLAQTYYLIIDKIFND